MEKFDQYQQIAVTYATEAGGKIIAAIILWIVGRWLIGLAGDDTVVIHRQVRSMLARESVYGGRKAGRVEDTCRQHGHNRYPDRERGR